MQSIYLEIGSRKIDDPNSNGVEGLQKRYIETKVYEPEVSHLHFICHARILKCGVI